MQNRELETEMFDSFLNMKCEDLFPLPMIIRGDSEMLSESFTLTLYKEAAASVVVRACSGYIREL